MLFGAGKGTDWKEDQPAGCWVFLGIQSRELLFCFLFMLVPGQLWQCHGLPESTWRAVDVFKKAGPTADDGAIAAGKFN